MNKILKKLLPQSYSLDTMEKPMHAGEIYHLWESLTASNQVISICETFQMNTEDKELHVILQGMVKATQLLRINKIETLLKDAGFTVPPRSAPKTLQGKPGIGQEVKLSDEEVIKVLHSYLNALINLDGRGIGTVTTNKKIRNVFIDLFDDDMKAHELILAIGKSRQALDIPPPATAAKDSLTVSEVHWLWFEMDSRHAAILELETFLNNTKDKELSDEIRYGLDKVSSPQLDQIEQILKQEGFTVPSRPLDRTRQHPEGRTNKIVIRDNEILELMFTAAQAAINNHIRAYTAAYREDIIEFYHDIIAMEIDNLDRIASLSSKRNTMVVPPYVTSRRG
ncbi:MAG: DUF3231 family protein [Candidatus Saccharibacteria bacterium]